jgi:hypothetical protein
MADIAVLTPDEASEGFHTRWPAVLAEITAPLEAAGHHAVGRSWTADLGGFDLVLPLLVWGYHLAGPEWEAATRRWEEAGLAVWNPPSVLRWNGDKAYLDRLAQAGAPVVPTRFAERLSPELMAEAAEAFGTDQLIAKPRVSAGAWRTIRWRPGAGLEGGPDRAGDDPALPPRHRASGRSFAHLLRRGFQPRDPQAASARRLRVQPEYQGIISAHQPAADELAAAEAALAGVAEPLLYARVDLVRDLDGRPVLMELELVEPDLYLRYDPASPARLADAVARLL